MIEKGRKKRVLDLVKQRGEEGIKISSLKIEVSDIENGM
jgi:hypothetical protein